MKKIKISIIGSVGLPARYGGWETLSENLVSHIADKFEVTVFCSSKIYKDKIYKYKNAKLIYVNLYPNGLQSIFYDAISLYKSNKFADITLILGISGAIFMPFLKNKKNKLAINLDGIEWKRSKWSFFTKIFLRLSEFIAVRFADRVIVDNKGVSDYIFDSYQKITNLIAYGGDQAKKTVLSADVVIAYNIPKIYAFKVARIEPENNIEMILNVFSKIELPLVIVGNWDSSKYGRDLKCRFNMANNIIILDAIYDQKILDQIRSNAFLYIHGHSVGGTNPSLVEAMCLGLPIFAYDVNFNRLTTENSCLYFANEKELNNLTKNIDGDLIYKIGLNMKRIADKKYNWNLIVDQYLNFFKEIVY